jgi:RimJ/RimL family protein N-acetyltransferase
MRIRDTTTADLDRVMEIYATARAFMAAHGNPNQWGPTNWPPRELIARDIAAHKSYVCQTDDDKIAAVFFYDYGERIDPCYDVIHDGAWLDDGPYGVVHRIAGDGSMPGIGTFCMQWAWEQCRHLRVDTHGDNVVMQHLLEKLGFVRCGTIYVEEDPFPRIAYEKTE